jgi:hypothetical protein
MNAQRIPVKYSMMLWKTLPDYPTKLDILYEVCLFLEKNGKTEFSEQTLNSIWIDPAGVQVWRGTKIEEIVKKLMDEGVFKEAKTVNDKVWYVINEDKNPFK